MTTLNENVAKHTNSKLIELLDEVEALKRQLTEAENRYQYELSRERRPLVYLACPYTHPDGSMRQQRYLAATRAAVVLTQKGLFVFSPITHSHPMAQCSELPGTWEFWRDIDRAFISCCHTMYVLRLEGWEDSRGVAEEVAIAGGFGIKVDYIDEVVC